MSDESPFTTRVDRNMYPRPEYRHPGARISTLYTDSVADFPPPQAAPEGAPNILLVLLDDVGFGWPIRASTTSTALSAVRPISSHHRCFVAPALSRCPTRRRTDITSTKIWPTIASTGCVGRRRLRPTGRCSPTGRRGLLTLLTSRRSTGGDTTPAVSTGVGMNIGARPGNDSSRWG